METEYDRLVNVANTYYENLSQLSVRLGRSRQFLSSYKKTGTIGRKLIGELTEKFRINPEFIQYGKEPMLLKEYNYSDMVKEPEVGYNTETSVYDASKINGIKIIDVPAHANVGSLAAFNDLPASFRELSIGTKTGKLLGIRVIGKSMEDARIFDGSIVLFEPNAMPTNTDIVIAILNGVLLIKRFEKKSDGTIILSSAHDGIPPIVKEIDDNLIILGVFKASINLG